MGWLISLEPNLAVDLLIGVWLICYGNNKRMGELQPYQGELLAQDEIVSPTCFCCPFQMVLGDKFPFLDLHFLFFFLKHFFVQYISVFYFFLILLSRVLHLNSLWTSSLFLK